MTDNLLGLDGVRVRKPRAPKGALRLIRGVPYDDPFRGQKAPSTKRYIKTHVAPGITRPLTPVRKHRAPKGALRPNTDGHVTHHGLRSESIERQTVHYDNTN